MLRLSGQLRQTWGFSEGRPASLFPLRSKSQLMLEKRWPSVSGDAIGVK